MRRLFTCLRQDLLLQFRQGFIYAGLFVAAFWIAVLSLLPDDALRFAIPAFLFLNATMTTFFFVAGLVLYEKREGVLEALIVTPLRKHEYLCAKASTLTLLAGVESLAIVALGWGGAMRFAPVLAGVVAIGVMNTLLGFLLVSRYDSINEFLMPAGLVSTLLQAPVLASIGLWESPLLYLWPTQGPMLLLQAGLEPLGLGDAIYAVSSTIVWTAAAAWLAHASFSRFIVGREGAR
jgi:fluoroquinolone transport system permease protein